MAVLNQNLDDTIDGSFRGVPDRLYADTRHTRKAFACLAASRRDCPKGGAMASEIMWWRALNVLHGHLAEFGVIAAKRPVGDSWSPELGPCVKLGSLLRRTDLGGGEAETVFGQVPPARLWPPERRRAG